MTLRGLALIALPCLLLPAGVAAQDARSELIRVFLDCPETNCDREFFVRAVPFVTHVRDRTDADVHILVTEQDAGGGGNAFTAVFIGRGEFADRVDCTLADGSDPAALIDRAKAVTTIGNSIRVGVPLEIAQA